MTSRILVGSDDHEATVFISTLLETVDYVVVQARGGMDCFETIQLSRPDLVILDWHQTDESVPELCKRIRRAISLSNLPIIVVSSRNREHDRVVGLESGADDYVISPFLAGEFIARIHAVLRRTERGRYSDTLTLAGVTLDRIARRVIRNGRSIDLAPTEFRLLEVLMHHAGRPLSRSALAGAIWPPSEMVDLRTIDVHIGRLRRALVRIDENDPIKTVRGEGYKFIERI